MTSAHQVLKFTDHLIEEQSMKKKIENVTFLLEKYENLKLAKRNTERHPPSLECMRFYKFRL